MKKKKINKAFLIPLFIGIGLIVGGIVTLIITATSMSMIMPDKIVLISVFFGVGGFMIMFVTPLVFILTNRKNLTIEQNSIDFSDSFIDLALKELNEKECQYCGAILKYEDTNCPNCGAKDID